MSAPPNYTNVTLMKAMRVKRYDPMPTPQHQWQRAEGEGMVHRIWSVLCASSIMARRIGDRLVTTPYATDDDGVSPLTLVALAKLLGEDDASNVRQAWQRGEELGIWRRESGKLWLNPDVTPTQIREAKERRKKVCSNLLTKLDLLKIKAWPKEKREQFQGLWNAVHAYEQARIAEATGRERDAVAPVKDSIKSRFGLDARHIERERHGEPPVPPELAEFVQTGEHNPEKGNVRRAASLLPAENTQRVLTHVENERSVGRSQGPQQLAAEGPDRKEVAAVPISLPPDMAAAETQRRQTTEPSSMGGEQSGDHGTTNAAGSLLATASPTPTDLELTSLLHAELGRMLPGEHPGPALCAKIRANLSGAPLDLLRVAIRGKVVRSGKRIDMGLVGNWAEDVGQSWRAQESARRRHGAANADQEAFLRREAESAARATLADPRSTPADLRLAREVLHGMAQAAGGQP